MIGSDKIFFDTSPFIYLVENHPKYSQPVTDFIVDQVYLNESLFFTSTRAKYDFLKAFDAIQLATAIDFGCNKFFTNDRRLKPIQEIDVILVDELIK